MSKLAQLLGHDHPLFVYNLAQLEKATGNAGVDTKLIADVTERSHQIIRKLGLNPADTLPIELYQALNAAVRRGQAEEILGDAEYVIVSIDDEPISLNPQDVIENSHHEIHFVDRKSDHATRQLRSEIIRRYAEHDRTNNTLVHQLVSEAGLVKEDDKNYQLPKPEQADPKEANADVPHILCVGDIITNAFIKLTEDYFEETVDEKGYTRLSFELGAKLPYDQVDIVEAVECSPNAAVSLRRLGLSVDLMSWLGDDEPGKGMIKYLQSEKVGVDNMVVEPGVKSSYHYVLRYGADRTKLQRFEDYSYVWQDPRKKPDWLYLGVLGEKTWPLHQSILNYLEQNPEIKLVFQPGMYHLMWGVEKMAAFYERAEIVIMNREEAAEVTGEDRGDIQKLIAALHKLGVNVPVVTDGAAGAYASDGQDTYFMPNYPDPAPPFDRTGAGDAFASTLTAALALGEDLETALSWAPINSMNVVQKLGAQAGLQTKSQIKTWLKKAPADYKVKKL